MKENPGELIGASSEQVRALPAIVCVKYPRRPLVLCYMSLLLAGKPKGEFEFGPPFRYLLGLN